MLTPHSFSGSGFDVMMTISSDISKPMYCESRFRRYPHPLTSHSNQVSLNLVADIPKPDDEDDSSNAIDTTVTQPAVKTSRSRKAAARDSASEPPDLAVIKERFIAMGGTSWYIWAIDSTFS